MTTWSHSVSWSKFKLALDCPLSLQHTIDRKPHGRPDNNYHQARGSLVQYAFQMYFNQGVNLRPGGQEPKTWERVADKVLASNFLNTLNVTYPHDKTEFDLKADAKEEILLGFKVMEKMGLTKLACRSEVKLNGHFRGFRMFAMVDFLREGKSGDWLFDGKGYSKPNADARQVVYYALNRASSGRTIAGAGLIYWRHGLVPVDVSPKALREFADGPLAEVRPIFEQLRKGAKELPPKPSDSTCWSCRWKYVCEHSAVKRKPMDTTLPEEVGME